MGDLDISKREEGGIALGHARVRTLVVDDSPQVLHTMLTLLKRLEWIEVVGTAGDGEEATKQVDDLHPDLVLMDMQMPKMDGLEATRRIRKMHPSTLVIIVTSHDNPEMRAASKASGAHAFLPKSRVIRELPSEIRRVLAESQHSGSGKPDNSI